MYLFYFYTKMEVHWRNITLYVWKSDHFSPIEKFNNELIEMWQTSYNSNMN